MRKLSEEALSEEALSEEGMRKVSRVDSFACPNKDLSSNWPSLLYMKLLCVCYVSCSVVSDPLRPLGL